MISGVGSNSNYDTAALTQMRQNLFSKLDTDGDGAINKTEFSAPSESKNTGFEEIFSKLDTDQDSYISQSEFTAGASFSMGATMAPPPPPPENPSASDSTSDSSEENTVSSIFSSLDTDDDGVIDKTELAAALASAEASAWSNVEDSDTTLDSVSGSFGTVSGITGMAASSSETDSGRTASVQNQELNDTVLDMILRAYSDIDSADNLTSSGNSLSFLA